MTISCKEHRNDHKRLLSNRQSTLATVKTSNWRPAQQCGSISNVKHFNWHPNVHRTYHVLLIIPILLVWNRYSDASRRNYNKTELSVDGINGCRNASEWKLVCGSTYIAQGTKCRVNKLRYRICCTVGNTVTCCTVGNTVICCTVGNTVTCRCYSHLYLDLGVLHVLLPKLCKPFLLTRSYRLLLLDWITAVIYHKIRTQIQKLLTV
jgi:hypothetical protein